VRRWTVQLPNRDSDLIVAADRMTITDGGTLIFWVSHDGLYADSILVAVADGCWSRVEVQK